MPSGSNPARRTRRPRSPLRVALQAAAVSTVALLLVLLTVQVLAKGAGSHLVS
jgi:hypothetical protein